MSGSEAAEKLKVDLLSGLSQSEAEARIKQVGPNTLVAEKKTPLILKFLQQFKSPVVLALLAATVVSAFLQEWIDAFAILIIVIINAAVSFYQEFKAENAVEILKKLSAPKARVFRDGSVKLISSSEICPGDVLVFEAGDFVPADARLVEARQLSVVEAALTGESLPVEKSEKYVPEQSVLGNRSSMIFTGTAIAAGSGRAIAVETGMNTELGKIAGLLKSTKAESTPLQKSLDDVGKKLLFASFGVIALIGVIGIFQGREPIELLMSAISLAVAAIPEGLPAVVTVALTLAVKRMVTRNAIVRHLPAVETLGSADVICTDKTGTLTTGQMELREIISAKSEIVPVAKATEDESLLNILMSASLCSNATYNLKGEQAGDPTEVALLRGSVLAGIDLQKLAQLNKREFEWSFDSDRKRMSVAVRTNESIAVHSKGAPESILSCSTLSEDELEEVRKKVFELSSKGRRVLAVATKKLGFSEDVTKLADKDVERDLKFLGLVSIADPPRVESIAAVKSCQDAGIQVVMITGDHPVTAQAIATELGIFIAGKYDGVLSGEEISRLSDSELKDRVPATAVYARVSPQDKLRIVNAWKARGKVVAMTGDGVNDAPALKTASIGIAMGRGGTEVARQASSMVLADDNFATIVSAVEEGRAVFGNIRRTVEYLLSGNLAEIFVMVGAALLGLPVPLAPIHLLWINLVTDGLPSLALAAEPVPKDILNQRKLSTHGSFSNKAFWLRTFLVGSVTGVMCLAVYIYSLNRWDESTARTLAFSFLVYAELFRSFASRSETLTFFELGARSNLLHLAAVLFPAVFQFFLHHSTLFQEVFNVRPLSLEECLGIFALTLVPVTFLELYKLLKRKRELSK